MVIIEQYPVAVVLCIVTMLCWGSWANTQKRVGKTWRFELFHWDYVIGVLVAAILFAFTLGSSGGAGRPVLLFAGVGLVAAAIVLDAVAYRRLAGQTAKNATLGLALSMICGLLMGFFYRFVAAAMAPDFVAMEPGKVGPYTAMVLFAAGLAASNFVFNTILMRSPVSGEPLTPASYFRGTVQDHFWGVAGGMIWAAGMTLSIITFGVAGPAISSGLDQGATMVAAAWGVFVWREFATASEGTATRLGPQPSMPNRAKWKAFLADNREV